MLIHYGDGTVLQGILLSLKGNQMRVAVKDADDVTEFRMSNEVWISDACEPVTFEFHLAIFEALGMMPDSHNVKPQPELLWQGALAADAVADLPN